MTLADLYETLAYGELHQIFMGNDASGRVGIQKEDFPRLLPHVILGLTTLYKRFLLREGTLIIQLQEGKRSYVIDSSYAESNLRSRAPVKYILDGANPYQEDLLRILQVFDAEGRELPLNVRGNEKSLFTPDYRTLEIPDCLDTEQIVVKYQANHPKIDPNLANAVPMTVNLELPSTHVEALLYFVASRVMNPIGLSGEFHEGNNYAAKFEQACQALEHQGHQIQSITEDDRRQWRGGWP